MSRFDQCSECGIEIPLTKYPDKCSSCSGINEDYLYDYEYYLGE